MWGFWYRKRAEELLARADICINGDRQWDIQIHDERVFRRVMVGGSLGLGEAYMDGWWDAKVLDQFFERIFRARLNRSLRPSVSLAVLALASLLSNRQRHRRAFSIGKKHYDIGNDLFQRMLDSRMVYTCAYWKNARTLEEAQEAKLDLVCRKLGLASGMRVLDIGCGWGSFLKFAAERYGVRGVGVTVSKEQVSLGMNMCHGLPVELRLQDYRDIGAEQFDVVVSLGMLEHVGYRNYESYFAVIKRLLKKDGLALIQTFGSDRSVHAADPWFDKYIFPGGMIPSVAQLGRAIEGQLIMEDWHNFGTDYDHTLRAWNDNFKNAWADLRARYDERFFRMWTYYLLSLAAAFRTREIQLWQIVLSPHGVGGGYQSVR